MNLGICLKVFTSLILARLLERKNWRYFRVRFKRRKVDKQESPAIADKPARRESLPKIAPIRRAYDVVADNTGLSSCV